MKPNWERCVLWHVWREWIHVSGGLLPWGLWLTQQPPVPEGQDWLTYEAAAVKHAWFLDEWGVHSRNTWEFRRFWTVQHAQPWCTREVRERSVIIGQQRFPIGIGAFAEYVGTDRCYVELLFGKLHGRGYELLLTADEVFSELDLWIS